MSVNSSSIVSNGTPWRNNEKLYLHERTADVFFTFTMENDSFEKIPAHRIILAAASPAFDAMFYGPAKQEGDIPIVDTNADAFKEFLQFFYLSQVKLTSDNVMAVVNLCKQYMLNDSIKLCIDFIKKTITLDNVHWGYELAVYFELYDLKAFCERKISDNATEVFMSSNFLACDQNVLRYILKHESLICNELMVFDRCMAWAKSACDRKGLDGNMNDLRSQLGELFHEIRFGDMTLEAFYGCYRLYEGLFTLVEFEDIVSMIASKGYQSEKFKRRLRLRPVTIPSQPRLRLRTSQKTTPNLRALFLAKSSILNKKISKDGFHGNRP